MVAKMLRGLLDRPGPLEAEVAVPGLDGLIGDEVADVGPRPVHVQPLVADHVRSPVPAERHDLRAENVAVEGVRPLPVGDGDDDVVEPEAQSSRSQ